MKKIAMYTKNIALIVSSIICITNFSTYAQNSTTVIKNLRNFIIKVEDILTQFFDNQNKTPYNDFVVYLGKTITDFEHKLEQTTRTPNDNCINDSCEIANYSRQQFNAAYGIIKQYREKSADHVGKFVADLQRVFSPETAFTNIINKLKNLHKKATNNNDDDLTHIIEQLIGLLEKKKTKWAPNITMLRALKIRMSCK